MKRSATQANQTSAKKQKLDGKDVFTQEFAKSGIEHSLVKVAAMHAYSVITNKDLSKPPVLVISPKYIANSGMTQEDFEKRFLSLHGGEVKNVMVFNKDKMTTVAGVPGEGMRVLPFKNMVVFLMLKAKDDEEVVFKELMKLIDILVKVNQHTGNVIIGGVLNMLPQLFSARMTTVKHRNDMKSAKELKELEEKFLKEVESDKKINTIVDLKNKEEFGVINETDVNLLTQYLFKEAGMKEDETGPHVEILKDAAKIIGIIQRETDQGKFKLTTAPKSDQLKRGVNVTPPSRLDNIYDDVTVTDQLKRGHKVRAPFRLDNIIYPISNINSRFKITPEQERASKVTNILLQKINNPITLPVNIVNDKIGTIVYADREIYNKKLAEIEHNEKIYQEKLRIENEKRQVAEEKRRAEEEKRRAEKEKRRAEEERCRAAEENRRADAAIEIAKMKAQLAKELEIDVKELENTKQTLVKTNKDLDKQRAVQGRGEFIKVLYINHNECPTLMEKLRPQGDRKRYFSIRKVAFNNDATFYRAYGGSWGLLSESRPLADAANTKNKLMAKLMKDGIINKRTWGLNGTERDYHHYFSKVHPDESLEKDNTFVLELNESMTMKDLGDYLFDHVTPGHEARGRIFIA